MEVSMGEGALAVSVAVRWTGYSTGGRDFAGILL